MVVSNSCRSVLSLLLGPHVESHELVKRFLKRVPKLRPNIPRYIITWDPDIVLKLPEHLVPKYI